MLRKELLCLFFQFDPVDTNTQDTTVDSSALGSPLELVKYFDLDTRTRNTKAVVLHKPCSVNEARLKV